MRIQEESKVLSKSDLQLQNEKELERDACYGVQGAPLKNRSSVDVMLGKNLGWGNYYWKEIEQFCELRVDWKYIMFPPKTGGKEALRHIKVQRTQEYCLNSIGKTASKLRGTWSA